MKRTSAFRPILFPGSSPTCRSLAPMCLGDIYYVYHSRGRGGGIVKEGLIKCFDRKQGTCVGGRAPPPPPPRMPILSRGTPLFDLNHFVPLNKVWFSGCWVLNRSGIQFHYLAFCTRCRFGLQALKCVNFGILISWVTVTIHRDNGGLLSCLLCEELHAL